MYGTISIIILLIALFFISWWIGNNTFQKQFQRLIKHVAGEYHYEMFGNNADVMLMPYEYDGDDNVQTEGLTIHYQLIQPKYHWILSTTADIVVSLNRLLPPDLPPDCIMERVNQALDFTDVQQDAFAVTYALDTDSLCIEILIPGQYSTATRLSSIQNSLLSAYCQ